MASITLGLDRSHPLSDTATNGSNVQAWGAPCTGGYSPHVHDITSNADEKWKMPAVSGASSIQNKPVKSLLAMISVDDEMTVVLLVVFGTLVGPAIAEEDLADQASQLNHRG
jgi:hypothetical protein